MRLPLLLLLIVPALQAMHKTPASPSTPKTTLSPKEVATVITSKVFDKPDEEVVSAFARIITKDPKGNAALLELRYRVLTRLEEERLLCGETH